MSANEDKTRIGFRWPTVVIVGLFAASAICALALGEKVLAATLAGYAGGVLTPSTGRVEL